VGVGDVSYSIKETSIITNVFMGIVYGNLDVALVSYFKLKSNKVSHYLQLRRESTFLEVEINSSAVSSYYEDRA
jgi:hypothetical protein